MYIYLYIRIYSLCEFYNALNEREKTEQNGKKKKLKKIRKKERKERQEENEKEIKKGALHVQIKAHVWRHNKR